MNINIKAHFDEEKRKHQELIAKAKSEKEKLQKDIAQKTKDKAQLEKEKEKKEALLRQNEEEGLDVTKLKDKIRELDLQMAQADKDIEALKTAVQKPDGIVQRSFEKEDLMVSVLTSVYGCKEAIVVEIFEDIFTLLPVAVTEFDKAGRPTKCQLKIASQDSKVLSIKQTNKHFTKNFRPDCLSWLPLQEPELSTQREKSDKLGAISAFYEKTTGRFILSKTRDKRDKRPSARSIEACETPEHDGDFASDIAISLHERLKAYIENEKEGLDLEKTYKENPLLAYVRSVVVSQTTPSPLFKECSEHLTSDDLYQRIKTDWDAFKNCPWSEDISGVLALLKYHVENGERARFWSGEFENQYGFRLRTRDHDWIVGELFIKASEQVVVPAKMLIKLHEDEEEEDEQIASLGRLFLRVSRDRSERKRY